MRFGFKRTASKYGNKKTVVAGHVFDSKWEAEHWTVLRQLESAHVIRDLQRQVRIPVVINGVKVCTFIADFVYEQQIEGCWTRVVSDCKSAPTRSEPYYRLKKKLLSVVNGIEILEVVKSPRR